jgi:hypothetical protein
MARRLSADFERFVAKVQKALPETRIAYLAVCFATTGCT